MRDWEEDTIVTGLPAPRRYRAMFLSDVHLGTRGCRAELLIDFLRHHEAGTIYLVGDIIDGWQLKSGWHWLQSHNDVAQKLLRQARKGARVLYIPGNHDEVLRDYCGIHLGGVEVVQTTTHLAADGRRYLVTHGDDFDVMIRHGRWLSFLGGAAHGSALMLNGASNRVRRLLGLPHASLSRWAKTKVKTAVNYISEFEAALSKEARRHGMDGVICGHIHHAANHARYGVHYLNCGDWLESCTALVEHDDGRFEIIPWTHIRPTAMVAPAQPQAA